MKKIIFTMTLVFLTSVLGFAQTPNQNRKTDPESVERVEPKNSDAKSSQNAENEASQNLDALLASSSTSLEARLKSTLDVKKSKVGDSVILETTKSLKQDGNVVIPKGTKLIGHITEVQRKTKENATSKIGILINQIQGKEFSSPISASIVSVASAAGNVTASDLFSSDSSAMGSSSTNASGGGLLGGATKSVGGLVGNTVQATGGLTNSVGQSLGGVSGNAGGLANGLMVNQTAAGSVTSGTMLSSQNKNIKIDSGTNFQLSLSKSIGNPSAQ